MLEASHSWSCTPAGMCSPPPSLVIWLVWFEENHRAISSPPIPPQISSLPCPGILSSHSYGFTDPLFSLSITWPLHCLNTLHMPFWWKKAGCPFIPGEEFCAQIFRAHFVFLGLVRGPVCQRHWLSRYGWTSCVPVCDILCPRRVSHHLLLAAVYPFPNFLLWPSTLPALLIQHF